MEELLACCGDVQEKLNEIPAEFKKIQREKYAEICGIVTSQLKNYDSRNPVHSFLAGELKNYAKASMRYLSAKQNGKRTALNDPLREFENTLLKIDSIKKLEPKLEENRGQKIIVRHYYIFSSMHYPGQISEPGHYSYEWGILTEDGNVLLLGENKHKNIYINTDGHHNYYSEDQEVLHSMEGNIDLSSGLNSREYKFGKTAEKTIRWIERGCHRRRVKMSPFKLAETDKK